MHGLVWSLAKCLYDQATVITRQVYLQVKKAGKDAWVSLSTALAQIRKEAAGDFSSSFDNAKESVRASHAPADDQPGRGRGRGSERGGARAGRPARRRDGDDLLPVLPEVSHTYLKAATCKCTVSATSYTYTNAHHVCHNQGLYMLVQKPYWGLCGR